MSWGFRKRIKVFPGVRLNIGKTGVSASFGVRGAHITMGSSGTTASSGFPGTGIYFRQKVGSGINQSHQDKQVQDQTNNTENSTFPPITGNDFDAVSTATLDSIKQTIIETREQKKSLKDELVQANSELTSYQRKKSIFSLPLVNIIFQNSLKELESKIPEKIKDISEIQEALDACHIDVDVEFEPEFENAFQEVIRSFDIMQKSAIIWDITDQKIDTNFRSVSHKTVRRKPVQFEKRTLSVINSKFSTPCLINANDTRLYIYPSFLLLKDSANKIALIELTALIVGNSYQQFAENETIPPDTKVIGKTWEKTNKDGSRDKRFRSNQEIPIVRYGRLELSTFSGMNELFYISQAEATLEFGKKFSYYIDLLKKHNAS